MKLKSLNLTNSTLHHARDVVSVNALKGCVDKDDTNPTIDKIAAADMILLLHQFIGGNVSTIETYH